MPVRIGFGLLPPTTCFRCDRPGEPPDEALRMEVPAQSRPGAPPEKPATPAAPTATPQACRYELDSNRDDVLSRAPGPRIRPRAGKGASPAETQTESFLPSSFPLTQAWPQSTKVLPFCTH